MPKPKEINPKSFLGEMPNKKLSLSDKILTKVENRLSPFTQKLKINDIFNNLEQKNFPLKTLLKDGRTFYAKKKPFKKFIKGPFFGYMKKPGFVRLKYNFIKNSPKNLLKTTSNWTFNKIKKNHRPFLKWTSNWVLDKTKTKISNSWHDTKNNFISWKNGSKSLKEISKSSFYSIVKSKIKYKAAKHLLKKTPTLVGFATTGLYYNHQNNKLKKTVEALQKEVQELKENQ